MVLDFKVREVIYREISNLFLFYPYKTSQICCITYKIFMHSSILPLHLQYQKQSVVFSIIVGFLNR